MISNPLLIFSLWVRRLFSLIVIISFLALAACINMPDEVPPEEYKQYMRWFVRGISEYSRRINNNFIIIPQNGQELVTADGEENGQASIDYLKAINGVGREDLFYGYDEDNVETPTADQHYMISFLDLCEQNNVEVLTTDYCSTHTKMDDSYSKNKSKGYISFAAPDRELSVIPDFPTAPFNENNNNITSLKEAQNFLYLLNTEKFSSKENFIQAAEATNYDIIIIDLFFDGVEFSPAEIARLKIKKNTGKRLVISYMSIGEAEDYRYYWNNQWHIGNPSWIAKENPDWPGNYKVKYWEDEWEDIIYGNDNSYLKKILNAGFDGVYLDIIDAFEYFE